MCCGRENDELSMISKQLLSRKKEDKQFCVWWGKAVGDTVFGLLFFPGRRDKVIKSLEGGKVIVSFRNRKTCGLPRVEAASRAR